MNIFTKILLCAALGSVGNAFCMEGQGNSEENRNNEHADQNATNRARWIDETLAAAERENQWAGFTQALTSPESNDNLRAIFAAFAAMPTDPTVVVTPENSGEINENARVAYQALESLNERERNSRTNPASIFAGASQAASATAWVPNNSYQQETVTQHAPVRQLIRRIGRNPVTGQVVSSALVLRTTRRTTRETQAGATLGRRPVLDTHPGAILPINNNNTQNNNNGQQN